MSQHDVTVIGAGIVGIACAIYLQRDGHRVTVIDKDEPGRGTSFGNAGSIAPSSIIPMALPGTLRNVPKWITDPLGPLTLAWRQIPALLPWFIHFRSACSLDRAKANARALRSINGRSIEAYTELLESVGASDLLQKSGMLHLYRTERGYAGSAFARGLRTDNQSVVEELDHERIHRIEPALSDDYRFGFLLPDNGHMRSPFRLVQVLVRHFVENGGTLLRTAVQALSAARDGSVTLKTDDGTVDVDRLVIAAGAASKRLAASVGLRVPIAPERGYHIEVAQPGVSLGTPVTDGDLRFVATPMEHALRFAGTSEFTHADAPPRWARADALAILAPKMLPDIKVGEYTKWVGTRPSTPDSLPVIGVAPRCSRVYCAFGHGHFGLMAAPPTGQVIADLLSGRPPRIDITPFRPDRF